MSQALRSRTLNKAHQGHQGIVKTKQLLRSKVWWPGIDKDVEKLVGDCLAYQATGLAMSPTPVQMSELPTHPRRLLHMDFCGPFPTVEMLFVEIDEYSSFPEVEIMRSTTAQAVILSLAKIFATHGLPEKVTSDNSGIQRLHEDERYYPPQSNSTLATSKRLGGIIHETFNQSSWHRAAGRA